MLGYWTVIQTKPRQEAWAEFNCQRQGCETYLPLFRPDLRKTEVRPLFPSYIFVYINGPWYFLKSTFGVSKPIVTGDGSPALISDKIIADLRKRQGGDGLVSVPIYRYDIGQKVRFKRGPFADRIAIFQGMSTNERIRVLMGMLQLTVPENILEAA